MVLLAAPACGFTVRTLEDGAPPGGDDTQDPPSDPTTARRCATDDGSLRLCIDFDDDQALTSDGSGRGHDATGSGFTIMERDGEQAALVRATSQLVVAESADLDLDGALTITLLANPARLPSPGKAFWALDNNKQYLVSYQDNGKFRCGIGNATVDSVIGLSPASWYHVACTFDRGKLALFVDGQLAGCRMVGPMAPTEGNDGLAIGANIGANRTFTEQFIGGLDNIQVFDRALSPDEVCDAADETDCWAGVGGGTISCQ